MLSPQTQAILKAMFPDGVQCSSNPANVNDFFEEAQHECSSIIESFFNGSVSVSMILALSCQYYIPSNLISRIAGRCYYGV